MIVLVFALFFVTAQASFRTSPTPGTNKTVSPDRHLSGTDKQVDQSVDKGQDDDDMSEATYDDAKTDDGKADKVEPPAKFLAFHSSPPQAPSSKSAESPAMTSATMEAAMTDMMLAKTGFGATPMSGSVKQIQHLLTKTMLPAVKSAHNSDQDELNRLSGLIGKCDQSKKKQPALCKRGHE